MTDRAFSDLPGFAASATQSWTISEGTVDWLPEQSCEAISARFTFGQVLDCFDKEDRSWAEKPVTTTALPCGRSTDDGDPVWRGRAGLRVLMGKRPESCQRL
jgi:hypothetical protein